MNLYTDYCLAAAKGAIVVTVNRRLARTLHTEFAHQQQLSGRRVWQRPLILTLNSWLRSCVATCGAAGRLLDNAQSDFLWQQVIRADLQQSGMSLMQIQASAKLAIQAHQLLCAAGAVSGSPNCSDFPACYLSPEHNAFIRWQTAYVQLCEQHNWIDQASMPSFVIAACAAGKIIPPKHVIFIGFDLFNQVQTNLFRQLEQCGTTVDLVQTSTTIAADLKCVPCADAHSEIVAAARWTRECLENHVGKIAVVVPNLEQLHAKVERIFRHELAQTHHPDLVPVSTFNVSLGRPLSRQGMIATALALLALEDEIDFESVSYLLRSPWLIGGESEAGARANFESWLRRHNISSISLSGLIDLCRKHGTGCRLFSQILVAVRDVVGLSLEQTMSQWAVTFESLLNQAGWPGDRSLSSNDYQILTAWQDKLLPQLASLSAVCDKVGRVNALSLVNKLANEQLFQPQAQDDRLQVIGLLESAGLHFDALWVMGLTDWVLPGTVQHNPFIPVALQRHYQMPHCSIEHENAFAKLTLQRLLGAAPQIMLSFPGADNERQLSPSPFIQPFLACVSASYSPFKADSMMHSLCNADHGNSTAWEFIDDAVGAPLAVGSDHPDYVRGAAPIDVSGGTNVLREQALCPFRAYVHCRLKVRALEAIQPGVDNRVRGAALHKILEQFWLQVGNQQCLCSLSDENLQQLVRSICMQELQRLLYGQALDLLSLEVERLTRLVVHWLQNYEKTRSPFKVMELEQPRDIQLGTLRFKVVPDRVDCLDSGGRVIIDYKTGLVHSSDLLGDKLLEPQLPVYALNANAVPADGEVVAVAFAQIRAGACVFKGVGIEDDLVAGVKSVAKSSATKMEIYSWSDLMDLWQQQLEKAAQDFTSAQAQVDPANAQTCKFCDLQRLCRIAAADTLSANSGTDHDTDGVANG